MNKRESEKKNREKEGGERSSGLDRKQMKKYQW
jgi:hypothetical protein